MAQVINTNVSSLTAQRNLNKTNSSLETSLARLSSGLRINSAKDDAAGLAIANKFTSQIRGLNQAIRNANDGISVAQVAEGALGESTEGLQRIRELAVQSANGSYSNEERVALQAEVEQLQAEINRIAQQTSFGGRKLLDGSFNNETFQVGAAANETISVSISNSQAAYLGANRVVSSSAAGAIGDTTALGATKVVNNVTAQTVAVAGYLGTSNISVAISSSAYTIAGQVNAQSGSTGVSATARTTATLGTLTATGSYTFNLYGSNTSAVAISANLSSTSDLSALADAINSKSALTGVTASATGGTVSLVNEQGYDIAIENFAGGGNISLTGSTTARVLTGGTATTDSATVGGTLTFNSSKGFTAGPTAANTTIFSTTGSSLTSVAAIDIGTQLGAQDALSVIDSAIRAIDANRSDLGAVQNRLTSTIANLQNVSENVSAARSRIVDADFAAETSNLTRASILQQAGISVLAQANALPQQTLALLQGWHDPPSHSGSSRGGKTWSCPLSAVPAFDNRGLNHGTHKTGQCATRAPGQQLFAAAELTAGRRHGIRASCHGFRTRAAAIHTATGGAAARESRQGVTRRAAGHVGAGRVPYRDGIPVADVPGQRVHRWRGSLGHRPGDGTTHPADSGRDPGAAQRGAGRIRRISRRTGAFVERAGLSTETRVRLARVLHVGCVGLPRS